MDELRSAVAPWYGLIKTVHVFSAMAWAWSTAVAWLFYLKPAFRRALARPADTEARRERDRLLERFDRGAAIEHVAFVLLLASGLTLWWIARFPLGGPSWLAVKLAIVVAIFVPMELVDVWLSHGGGNKERARKRGETERYDRLVRWHWTFFRVTEPIVATVIPLVVFLATAKPF